VRQGLAAQEAEPHSNAAVEINALWRQVSRELWPPVADAAVETVVAASERQLAFELG
jgi:hypothetical protein